MAAQKSIFSRPQIAIVDYGMGNLNSVYKALSHLKAHAVITSSPAVIARSEKIILPGVGAFGDAMKELKKKKLIVPLMTHLQRRKKFLGICLGLQLLFQSSEESPDVKGLGVWKGAVKRFKTRKAKVPHMGWNQLKKIHPHPILKGITSKDFFYFVHSFYAVPSVGNTLAQSEHGAETFAAITGGQNAIAVQFHPEKSQESGLRLLNNFIRW